MPSRKVTPLVGVWIEISNSFCSSSNIRVTPLVGVWIEIKYPALEGTEEAGHSPCGSVD